MPCKITDQYANGVQYDMVGISQYEGMLQAKMPSGDSDWWNIDICQLILTPLSEITDEHVLGVANIMYDGVADKINNRIGYMMQVAGTKQFAQKLFATPLNGSKYIAIIDYLRSKSYDLGHGQIPSLIEAGIAIKKD